MGWTVLFETQLWPPHLKRSAPQFLRGNCAPVYVFNYTFYLSTVGLMASRTSLQSDLVCEQSKEGVSSLFSWWPALDWQHCQWHRQQLYQWYSTPRQSSEVGLPDCLLHAFSLTSTQSSRQEVILKSSIKWHVTEMKLVVALDVQQSVIRHTSEALLSHFYLFLTFSHSSSGTFQEWLFWRAFSSLEVHSLLNAFV